MDYANALLANKFDFVTSPSPNDSFENLFNLLYNETTPLSDGSERGPALNALIAVVCGVIILGTIVGNTLVCLAVALTRKLRTPSNVLIVSLAVSDLLVAVTVMPLALGYEIMARWIFGQTVCDIWTSLDVFLCTSSILNLCMISIDRYLVITRPFTYAINRTPLRLALMIAAVWLTSGVISIPPLFGWKRERYEDQCHISQEKGYQFFATIGAFYIPLLVMIFIYTRIYMVSARLARNTTFNFRLPSLTPSDAGSGAQFSSTGKRRVSSPLANGDNEETNHLQVHSRVPENHHQLHHQQHHHHPPHQRSNSFGEMVGRLNWRVRSAIKPTRSNSESKATVTLGVIMGAFVACWLPFFILALIRPFCRDPSDIPHWLELLFQWLGFANSFINPIIYARFNRDFRLPFLLILQCRCRTINSLVRLHDFAEQFGRQEVAVTRLDAGGQMARAMDAEAQKMLRHDLLPPIEKLERPPKRFGRKIASMREPASKRRNGEKKKRNGKEKLNLTNTDSFPLEFTPPRNGISRTKSI